MDGLEEPQVGGPDSSGEVQVQRDLCARPRNLDFISNIIQTHCRTVCRNVDNQVCFGNLIFLVFYICHDKGPDGGQGDREEKVTGIQLAEECY